MNTSTYLIPDEKLKRFKERRTGQDTIDEPFKSQDTSGGTPATGVPIGMEDACREGPSPDWGNQYKRNRSGSRKRENKSKNRKAAKTARKDRKASR